MKKLILLCFLLIVQSSVAGPFYSDKDNNKQEELQLVENKDNFDNVSLSLEPLIEIDSIPLKYANAEDVVESLSKGMGNILEGGYLYFDKNTNAIILKSTQKVSQKLTKLIKKLDKPIKQVAIEARIVTISSEHLEELGVRWGIFNGSDKAYWIGGKLEGNGFTSNNLNINFPVVSNAASVTFQVATLGSRLLDLELTALEQENSVEIIASPSLITTNAHKASIKQGTDIAYPRRNEEGDIIDVDFRDAVLGLEVTPHFTKKNDVLLDLRVTQNSPNSTSESSHQWVTIDKQEIHTQILAKDGKTIVLGGIFQKINTKEKDALPLIGSLPVLKYLFSHSKNKRIKRELVIFVTPHIINPNK